MCSYLNNGHNWNPPPKNQPETRLLPPSAWLATHLHFTPDPIQSHILDHPGKRVLLNCSRQWGKSTITAAKTLYLAHHHPASLSVVVSPSARQSGEFLRKVQTFAQLLNIPKKGDGTNVMSLQLPNQSRIVALPESDDRIRGFSGASLVVIDEAARVRDAVYASVRPYLAVSNGALWMISTPKGKTGFFWKAWERGGARWERIRVTAFDCPRISREFLAEEREEMGERLFCQEYLCEFTDAVSRLFDRDLLERAVRKDIPPLRFPW